MLRACSIVALAFLALACRSNPTAPNEQPDLLYALEWLDAPSPAVGASLELTGAADGITRVGLESTWGGVPEDGAWIRDVRAHGAGGRALEVEREAATNYRVRHGPGERVIVEWRLEPLADEAAARVNEYRPVVRQDCVHLIGNNALLAPLDAADAGIARSIALHWRGFDRPGWSMLSSHGAGTRVATRRSLSSFRQALFVAGSLDVERRDVPGGILLVAGPRETHALPIQDLARDCERIVAAERAFFADHSQPYYLIGALPVGAADPGRFSVGGTALTDSFALFYQRGASLAPESPSREPLLGVLAHELFHNWCGLAISPQGVEQLVYWFSEGFTEFYTGRMLRRAGLLDAEGRRRWANELMASYATSRSRDEPNAAIAGGFWSDPELGLLPYRRGALAALWLDGAIRLRSGGARSLDELMRALLTEARAGETFTTDELLSRFEVWTDADLRARLERFLNAGGLPPWTTNELAAFGDLGTCESHAHELGFDLQATLAARELRGVREQGPAWRAGLRDGLPLAGLTYDSRGGPVQIHVREGEAVVERSYEPRGAPVSAPCLTAAIDRREP
jgi:predicted metalloprotease with PDZ domain